MVARLVAVVCSLAVLFIAGGCDPREMVQKKVPAPLKDVLSSGAGAKKGAVGVDPATLQMWGLDILSPKGNSVLTVAKDVTFQAKISTAPLKDDIKPQVVWTLFSGKGEKGVQIGRGEKVGKKLDPGPYKIQAILVYHDLKIERELSFRVACMTDGVIISSDGTPLPGTNMVVTEIGSAKPMFQAQTDREGKFSVEIPQQDFVELSPVKQGYSFYPCRRVVNFVLPVVLQEFKGTKADIKDINFSERAGKAEPVDSVCPLQEGFVSFSVQSEVKPRSVEALLVRVEDGQERLVPLEDPADESGLKRTVKPEGNVLRVQVPSALAVGPKQTSYRLRLTVNDEKNNTYSAEAPELFNFDVMRCFRKTLADGVHKQMEGKLEQAVAAYRMIAKYNEKIDDQTPFAPFMKQSSFNKALAYLGLAMEKKPDSIDRMTMLSKAVADFQAVLQSDRKDVEASMFLGLCFQLLGSVKQSLEYYDKVLEVDPNFPGVRELRAQAQVQTASRLVRDLKRDLGKVRQGSKNIAELTREVLDAMEEAEKPVREKLLAAVDDFTAALTASSGDTSLRQSRRQVLNIAYELGKGEIEIGEFKNNLRKLLAKEIEPRDVGHPVMKVELSQIPLRELHTVVDKSKYVRQ